MSKRKNRSSGPNLPQEAIERARRQIAEENGEVVTTPEPVVEKPKAAPPKPVSSANPITGTRASRVEPMNVSAGRVSSRRRSAENGDDRRRRDNENLDMDTVRYRLQHPTREVTLEEMHEQYGYVAKDLRQIGILAVALVAVLIIVAQFL